MRGHWKIGFRARKAWIIRRREQVADMFSVARNVFTNNRFFAAIQSRFRGAEVRAAHKAEMPVGEFDVKRRAFLKYALFGGTLFLAGKYLTPLINTLRGDEVLSEKTFQNFKLTETGKELLVTDDDGNEILTIDKEGF